MLVGFAGTVTMSDLNLNIEALESSRLEYKVPVNVLDNGLIADRAVAGRST